MPWDIFNLIDFFLAIVNMVVALLFIIYACVAYYRVKKHGSGTKQIKIMFAMILSWGILYIVQFTYAICICSIFPCDYYIPETFIFIYASVEALPKFIVEGLVLLIPYKMLTDFDQMMDQRRQSENFSIKQLKFYRFVRSYQIVRFIRFIPSIIILCGLFLRELQLIQISYLCGILMDFIEAIICLFVIIKSEKIILKKDILIRQMTRQDYLDFKVKFLFLRIIAVLKIVFSIIIYIPLVLLGSYILNTFGNMLIGQTIIYLMPIYGITKQYIVPPKIQNRPQQAATIISQSQG